jgi:hypothetical protein
MQFDTVRGQRFHEIFRALYGNPTVVEHQGAQSTKLLAAAGAAWPAVQ